MENNIEPVKKDIGWERYLNYFNKIGQSADNVVVIHNFVEKDDLNEIMDYLKLYENNENFRGGNDIRQEQMAEENPSVYNLVKKYQSKVYEEAMRSYITKNDLTLQEYPHNAMHFVKWVPSMSSKNHSDCQHPNGEPLLASSYYKLNISALIYPNDDYEGGSIVFKDYGINIKPQAGDLVMFPSNNYYIHEVTEVKNGIRYTMPVWFTFDFGEPISPKLDRSGVDPRDSFGLWRNPGEDTSDISL